MSMSMSNESSWIAVKPEPDEMISNLISGLDNTTLNDTSTDMAVKGCVVCGDMKTKIQFSRNQWTKGPDVNKCIECVNVNVNVK
mmetsp:Transcript_13084/g.17132  ORF Transcript_13084/g.17132 Transcript_13084/m.17132 type:complete len:84 (-) Transcript_13084:176-427(-)